MTQIEAKLATVSYGSASGKPWLVYINGVMLKTKKGNGRRFKTKEAAEKAALAA